MTLETSKGDPQTVEEWEWGHDLLLLSLRNTWFKNNNKKNEIQKNSNSKSELYLEFSLVT